MTSVITDFVLMLSSSVGLSILAKATVILLIGLATGVVLYGYLLGAGRQSSARAFISR